MAYADATYYKTTFAGANIPDAELDAFLARASDVVDSLTFNKITLLTDLSVFQQNAVKKATCYQADHLYAIKDFDDNVQSYSVEGVSVSYKESAGRKVSSDALPYLMSAGLLYRGL